MYFARKIFLVDDDAEDREIFIEALNKIDQSIQCRCAHNGEDALKTLIISLPIKPNLIFLDLNMPRLNGLQVLAELKKMEELKNIRVIMYSTFFGENDVQKMKNYGATDFLIKPAKFDKLVDELTSILGQIHAADS